ncbi:substrate-binding domain-containing protein [Kluyvera intermedia]|uniref:substrate-binding domain-containing protein n=1 Tax=Kluyvera intermedia TaxID=61648 RepID=UPI001F31F865|nr:substrate-binding domain-containing protein [Kluyvera intermedia]MCE9887627.1 substrate-binding domain-containing protein [Kluyvera intermedia]
MHPTLTLFAAGSLRRAFLPLQAQFTAQTGIAVDITFGPAGLLRERIEKGEACSANRQHPQALYEAGRAQNPRLFARNELILTVKNSPQTAGKAWLELLSDSALRLGTSTPQCDPSGDYTWQLFDHIEASHLGLGESLKRRAMQLVGGRDTLTLPPGVIASSWLLREGWADLFIGYAHYATALVGETDIRSVPIPAPWNIRCEYYVTLLEESDAARQFCQFMLAQEGQRCLHDAGFLTANV